MKRYCLVIWNDGVTIRGAEIIDRPNGDWVRFDDATRTRRRLLAKLLRERETVIGQNIYSRSECGYIEDDWDECAYRRMAWCDRIASRLENPDPEAERQRWSERMGRVG